MGQASEPILERDVIPWLRRLLADAAALEDQQDPCWRHAYGIAQGAGFSLKSRTWPPFPTTSGASFVGLLNGEKVRRERGGEAPGDEARDPLTAAATPGGGIDGIEPQAAQAEQLIAGLLRQARALEPSDPAWRHACGIAQGYGALRRDAAWPPLPTADGSRFGALVAEEFARRAAGGAGAGSAPAAPAAPAPAARTAQRPGMLAALGGSGPRPPAAPRPPAPPPAQPAAPLRAAAAAPPGEIGVVGTPTLVEDELDEALEQPPTSSRSGDSRSGDSRSGEEGDAFRAMPTLMDAGGAGPGDDDEDEPAAPRPAPAAPPPPRRAAAVNAASTLLEAGDSGEVEPSTLLDAAAPPPAPAPRPTARRPAAATPPPPRPVTPPPARRPTGPLTGARPGGIRDALSGAPPKQQQQPQRSQAQTHPEDVRRIGSFEITGLLGKGAMGQVFRGVGPGGEVVAVKVLHQRFGKSKRVKARFVREAKAVERIQHPNVVRFFETGEQEGLGQYIAMEFVDGVPMNDLMKRRRGQPFEPAQALDYFAQCCRGLRAAHEAGVIHRDLKPENVLVSNAGVVKITDFSLARRDEDSMLLTRPGQVMGTPHFMSPEQAKGEAVDGRTDIYSLGAMLYVMLTGKFPFPRNSVSEVIAAHCEEPRPDPRAVNPSVPAELAELSMRLMALERTERAQTVGALLEELRERFGVQAEEPEDDLVIAGALPAGTAVGGFTIEKVLGAGGMGAVYRAKGKKGEPVALKVLPHQPGRTPQERIKDIRRFHNEAKIAKRVASKNVYTIHEFGTDPGGQAFIAMSLEEGTSLKALIDKRGFLAPALVGKVARGVCQALQAIREAGFVHRDVTPANVILRGDFEGAPDANACLIDFGLAIPLERERKKAYTGGINVAHIARANKQEEPLELDEDSLFLEELPGGTPAYMAPEVLEDPALVDDRADLYGLGATLYHAATGHPPYTGDTMEAVVYQQRSQAPAPITQFNADFPEELGELITQLLANTPNGRPRSAKLMLSKLARLDSPGAVAAWRPPGPQAEPAAAPEPEVRIERVPAAFSWSAFGLGAAAGAFGLVVLVILMPHLGIELPTALIKLLGG